MVYRRLRDLREDQDLTQKYIASLLYVERRTYSNYELGRANIPIEQLSILADFYKTSIDYLVGRTNVKQTYPKPVKR
ncbi:MAG: helix-turn-helix transcriptional regulator [Eubacteriales bacterium]|nr:helix-turn-helix transcriptional regulator [Eubacteriales bacterium]